MKLSTTLLAAAAGIGFAGTASAQVQNGGFELPDVPGSCCTTTPPDALPRWTVTAGDVNVVIGTFSSAAGNLAFEGEQYADLIGQGTNGTLEQALSLTAGLTYELTFAYSHNLFAGSQSASGAFSVAGLSDTVEHTGGSNSDLNWQVYTGRFTAGSANTLSFSNLTGADNAGLLLDAVSISAVPEPATWALMIGGFGMVGGAMRRRRAVRVAYA